MNPRLLIPLTLVAAVVLLSGCTLPGITLPGIGAPTGIASGVIVKDFRPDISEIYAGDMASFYLTVENVGEQDAENVNIRLFGLGTDWEGVPATEPTIDILQRSQPDFNVPGGLYDTTFTVTSPDRAKGKYQASVRVTYEYSTEASGNLKVYNNEYLKTIPREAETIMKSSALESFDVTNAPVTIALAGVARPLIYREDATNVATITIQISNIGQGYPYTGDDIDSRNVTIDSITVYRENCDNWDKINKGPKIPRDGSASFACKFELEPVDEYTTVPIYINISYNYYVDATTSINVIEQIV